MKHVLSYLCDRPWVITPRAMERLNELADRPMQDLEAVAAKLGRPLDNTGNRVEMRGDVAVLGVEGPIFRYANLFTMISGATSIELLSRDFNQALENKAVHGILLNINSPGGDADGLAEMADMIYDARAKKPVYAYIGGTGASGAYWLASAASKVIVHETALVGSIGVVATIRDDRVAEEKAGIRTYEIVSSQSPRKRPDISTDAGRAQIQEMVDAMADVFIARVAQFRSVTASDVTSKFGRGGVLFGKVSQEAGMADTTGSYEGVLALMNSEASGTGFSIAASGAADLTTKEVTAMAEDKQPDPVQLKSQERARISAILDSPEAKGREKLARHLALDTDMSPDQARGIMAAAPEQTSVATTAAAPTLEARPDALTAHMREMANPVVGVDSGAPVDETVAEIAAITAFLPSAQRRKPS